MANDLPNPRTNDHPNPRANDQPNPRTYNQPNRVRGRVCDGLRKLPGLETEWTGWELFWELVVYLFVSNPSGAGALHCTQNLHGCSVPRLLPQVPGHDPTANATTDWEANAVPNDTDWLPDFDFLPDFLPD